MTVGLKETDASKKTDKNNEISDEDVELKEKLDLLVTRLDENDSSLYKQSLESLRTIIRSSTTSLTSVPKPLKFMREHYDKMVEIHEKITDKNIKKLCADIVSILSITSDDPEKKYDSLKYRLIGSCEEIGAWGHEYVRHISSQITGIWNKNDLSSSNLSPENAKNKKEYMKLVHEILPYLMNHNAESEAIDLCIEVEELELIEKYTCKTNYERVCLYIYSCVPFLPSPDNNKLLMVCTNIYRKFDDIGNAVRCVLRMNDQDLAIKIFEESKSYDIEKFKGIEDKGSISKQLAYVLGRHQFVQPFYDAVANGEEELAEALGNTRLYESFQSLGRELDILEPKEPEDIYKTHLESRTGQIGHFDNSKLNLASSFVNGLVNCGFGKDKLMLNEKSDNSWLNRHKDFGKMNTVATLGWVLLWDVDCGMSQIDKYFYSEDSYIRAGALLGCGVCNCGVNNECDPALALLGKHLEDPNDAFSKASIIGLGVGYAGTAKEDVINALLPIILIEDESKYQLSCLAALSCGMIAVGTLDGDVTSTIIQKMLDKGPTNSYHTRFMALGLALTCMQRQEDAEVILASLEAVAEPFKSMAHLMCDFCAYAGTGNVLKVQRLLQILSEKVESNDSKSSDKDRKNNKKGSKNSDGTPLKKIKKRSSKPDQSKSDAEPMETEAKEESSGSPTDAEEKSEFNFAAHQSFAALGVAMISMGEDIGLDMAFRIFGHLLRFGEPSVKRAVIMSLALSYVSNPQLKVLDTLSKFSHDSDNDIATNSILALGIVGAGTNNARLAAMLRQLANYSKENNFLYMVRLAQGLTHLGKGTLTLSPFHSDRSLLRPVSLAALLTLTVSWLDPKQMFQAKNENLIFYLTPAIQPRMLMTFDEKLNPLSVPVRVGQAVDVVGQAGRPKTLTGFQTHSTPVLLSHGERAELATEEYLPVTKLPLEGFVILSKNPEFTSKSA